VRTAVVAFGALLAACASSKSGASSAPQDASPPPDAGRADALPEGAPPDAGGIDAAGIVAARPYTLHVPTGYDPGKPTPLVVMFHGYSASGALEEAYFGLTVTSDAHDFLYAYGDGTTDKNGNEFWNATDACCNYDGSTVDDVAYFDAIVADVSAKKNVDPKRVYVIGHSNGGFMAHRLACGRAGTVAAILSLEGAVWNDASKCNPSEKVSVVEVHGTADTIIAYAGGTTQSGAYPGALQTVATWAAKDGCSGALAATAQAPAIVSGMQTTVQAYGGCPSGVDVELWTVQGGQHIPTLAHPGWGEAVWSFLDAHPKP
jgi:polyhydroxybutyrate depolymerase